MGKDSDPRGFLIVEHDKHGYLLLKADKAKKGGLHWQLCGGHVDPPDFLPEGAATPTGETGLQYACRVGAAREFFEETGIDMRGAEKLSRLQRLPIELGIRSYFYLKISDADQLADGPTKPLTGEDFKIKISHEHVGFAFEKSLEAAAPRLDKHSGGNSLTAVKQFSELLKSGQWPAKVTGA
eukprot:Selendium_serpulae@DN6454_c5_g1_i1.p1